MRPSDSIVASTSVVASGASTTQANAAPRRSTWLASSRARRSSPWGVVQAGLMVQQPLLARPVGGELRLELSVEPQQELLGVDGIRPHAVRTRPQRIAHLLPGRRTGGGDENRRAGGDIGIDAQGATQARGIAIGERRVEDDGVRLRAARLLERIGSREGLEDG